MPKTLQKITSCLWFDTEAEDAANFYTSIFDNSRILKIARYGKAGPRPEGSVLTVDFELSGQRFVGLNGGPEFPFTEAVSLMVDCDTQQEVDELWETLTDGGKESQCGWLKDRYGLSWQIVPSVLVEMISDDDSERSNRVMESMLKMVKLDIAELQRAYDGK